MRLPSKIDRILSTGELLPIFTKARELRALAGLVHGFFPQDLARQVRLANFREGQLVLVAASPAAAAKVRLMAPSLIRFLSKQRWQVNSVSTRVQPSIVQAAVPTGKIGKSVEFSTATLEALQGLYRRLADSPARRSLGALLERHGAPPPAGGEGARARPAAPRKGAAALPRRRRARP